MDGSWKIRVVRTKAMILAGRNGRQQTTLTTDNRASGIGHNSAVEERREEGDGLATGKYQV